MTTIETKSHLLGFCKDQLDLRYSKIKKSISNIEESLLEESKNSSGDKHETGRAMLQIDRENAGKQMLEIERLYEIQKKIDVNSITEYVRLGSIVQIDKTRYFISLSMGSCVIDGFEYFCVALNSPIGMALSGKVKDNTFSFNGSENIILEVR